MECPAAANETVCDCKCDAKMNPSWVSRISFLCIYAWSLPVLFAVSIQRVQVFPFFSCCNTSQMIPLRSEVEFLAGTNAWSITQGGCILSLCSDMCCYWSVCGVDKLSYAGADVVQLYGSKVSYRAAAFTAAAGNSIQCLNQFPFNFLTVYLIVSPLSAREY